MSSIEQIKTTIRSTQKTRKITSTMKSVALSKLRRAQQTMSASDPYAKKIMQVIGHIAHSHSEYQHPFMMDRNPIKQVGYIVVSSDRGLCGGLNAQLFREMVLALKQWQSQNVPVQLCLVGNKGIQFFNRLSVEVLGQANHLGDRPSVMDTVGVVQVMIDAFLKGKIDRVMLASNQFHSMMSQKPSLVQLLPIVPADDLNPKALWDYIYEPDAKEVLDLLLNRYIEATVYQAVIENIACEQASRMIAMDNATSNADDVIDELKLLYNKARQAAITKELAEIVSGADAV
jgi:F-type H+-transporting ATPase subunit gamma